MALSTTHRYKQLRGLPKGASDHGIEEDVELRCTVHLLENFLNVEGLWSTRGRRKDWWNVNQR